jgi:cytochrome oxidase Cu insertion factor (SCO1/SenC/PrrC family)
MFSSLSGWAFACGLVAVGAAFQQAPAPAQPPPPRVPTLKVGDVAPAFALQGSDGKVHRLSDYKGKTVVLAWFPKAFTGG